MGGDVILPMQRADANTLRNWAEWREKRTRIVVLDDGTEIKIRVMDMLALLDGDGDTPNPLLAIAAGHTKNAEAAGKSLMDDPKAIHAMRAMLNGVMLRVVVDPPLRELGHEGGVSVDEFTTEEKMRIFESLLGGGERFGSAVGFHEELRTSLVTASDGE